MCLIVLPTSKTHMDIIQDICMDLIIYWEWENVGSLTSIERKYMARNLQCLVQVYGFLLVLVSLKLD